MPRHRNPIEVFWQRVNKEGPIPSHVPELGKCWAWTAPLNPDGYGMYSYERRSIGAHRVSYYLRHGRPTDKTMQVLHKCDNPACVNPDHLFLGTQKDNIQDCIKKGRHTVPFLDPKWSKKRMECTPRGIHNGMAKMNPESVKELRQLRSQGWSYRSLMDKYGITMRAVACIVKRITWRHVP